MCGIYGFYRRGGLRAEDLNQSLAALRSIAHRGPDGEGALLINTRTGAFASLHTADTPAGAPASLHPGAYESGSYDLLLGHRRLSILDLSLAGHQPMQDEAGNWVIFNGEIYNYIELREQLRALGHSFRSGSDTEVLMAAWREWGEAAIPKFNGMWAIALWDARQQKLLLTTDRFGVKPLYYFVREGLLAFCSEIKGFLPLQDYPRTLHKGNLTTFVEDGTTDHNFGTLLRDIHRFPWGHYTLLPLHTRTEPQPQPYWSSPQHVRRGLTYQDACAEFRDIFYSAVSLRMRADVDWGTSLSGGLDSSAIAYVADELLHKKMGVERPLYCFSAIFPGKEGDESSHIRFIEQDLQLKARYTNPMELFTPEEFRRHIWHQDYPVSNTSMFAEWAVMKLTAENGVKVLLDGQGSDELFAGYHHYFYRYMRELALRGRWGLLKKEMRAYQDLKEMPSGHLGSILRGELKQFARLKLRKGSGPRYEWNAGREMRASLDADFGHLMLPAYLRSEDRDSMAFSVETRTPFLDYRIVEFARTLPPEFKIRMGWQKAIVRDALPIMPDRIRYRKDKKGYTTPQNEWLRLHADALTDMLAGLSRLNMGLETDPDAARAAFRSGNADRYLRLASLGIWADQFLP